MKKRVLLFNPPPSVSEQLIKRNLICSSVPKGRYLYPPYDLISMSAILTASDVELAAYDAMIRNRTAQDSLEYALKFAPDVLILQTTNLTFHTDRVVARSIKEKTGCRVLGFGNNLYYSPEKALKENPWLDGILLDHMGTAPLCFVRGTTRDVPGLVTTDNSPGFDPFKNFANPIEYSIPRHDLFEYDHYRLPQSKYAKVAHVTTSYSCPFPCEYCPASTFEYRLRRPAGVLDELEKVLAMGFKEVIFNDSCFGAHRKNAEEILHGILARKLKFNWLSFARADTLDEGFIKLMAASGCHLLQIGIESADKEVCEGQRRFMKKDLELVIDLCKKYGIEVLGTFVIGLPGDTEKKINSTIQYAIDLDLDIASFNLAVPMLGTKFREKVVAEGTYDANEPLEHLDSFRHAHIPLEGLDKEKLLALRLEAERRFYLRPAYLVKRLLSLNTPYRILTSMREGWDILSRTR